MVPSGKTAAEPFAVIREAMASQGRVALGKVVMASRERQVAVEVRKSGLLVSTLRSHDEVRADAEVFDAVPEARVTPQMVEIAKQIIAQSAGPFDPEDFRDRYEDAVRELVEAKAGGAAPKRKAAAPDEGNVISLMDALRRSLKGAAEPDAGSAKPPAARRGAAKPAAKAAKATGPKPRTARAG